MPVAPTTMSGSDLPLPAGRPVTVEEYHRLIDAGVLTEDHDVELLDGTIEAKMARKPDHDITIELLEAIRDLLPKPWRLRIQSAITLPKSEPEPDAAIVRGSPRERRGRHPGPAEIGIVIEVADRSLQRDRSVKGPIYAEAGLPEYWLINLVDKQIEVYSQPSGPASEPEFANRHDYRAGEMIPIQLDGNRVGSIAADDLLP
jgi:Uma2 family endonuclease